MVKTVRKRLLSLLLLLTLSTLPAPAMAKGVILNFTDVDIATMVKFISDLTGKNFVMDERVKGKISVFSPSKLTNDEAFNVFTSVLELKGFTLIQSGKAYKIVPTASAKQSGTKLYSDKEKVPVNESYVARVINLENISAQEAVTFLQPVISKDGHVSAFGPANMLLVVDSSFNLQKVMAIVQMIDAEKRRELPEIIYLKSAGADNVAKVLQDWLGAKAAKQPGQPGAAAIGTTVVADTRLNAVLVFGGEKDKEEIRKMVALVDVAPPTSSGKVNVYYLENADAVEVGKVLEGVVKGSSAAQPGQAAAPQNSPFEGGKISITPDKATNSLVIMASPTDYQNLLQVIQKLDRKRRQVFVQAMIAEVSLSKAADLGVEWGFFGGGATGSAMAAGSYDPFGAIGSLSTIMGSLTSAGLVPADMKNTKALNFAVVLKALQSNGILNVLSSPTILTSDNKEAEIFVGENVPFAGTTTIGTGGVSQQSVERKDTGITLKITPQITDGDYIRLDVQQEISALKSTAVIGAAKDLVTTKRSAKTSVIVKDQETVAIGGLISETENITESKVPLLGDLPLLGWLFKSKGVSRSKTNLILLLTPRMISDGRDLAETTSKQRDRFSEASKKVEPVNVPTAIGTKPAATAPAEPAAAPKSEVK
ncbi:MAG: type II secretion system protein GspD [Geobacter sp.]|nr:type II secretion system protein GspD [Geobacter sp.]